MDDQGIHYYMTYGFYNPQLRQFVLVDDANKPRHYFIEYLDIKTVHLVSDWIKCISTLYFLFQTT